MKPSSFEDKPALYETEKGNDTRELDQSQGGQDVFHEMKVKVDEKLANLIEQSIQETDDFLENYIGTPNIASYGPFKAEEKQPNDRDNKRRSGTLDSRQRRISEGSRLWPKPLVSLFSILQSDTRSFRREIYRLKTLRALCCTWNMAGKKPSSDALAKMLPRNECHVYIIATQECSRPLVQSAVITSMKTWELMLRKYFGSKYKLLRAQTLQGIHLVVFLRKELLRYTSGVESAIVAAGYRDTLGNKGATAVSFSIGRTSFLCISAHLQAGQSGVKERNEQFHRIDTQISLQREPEANGQNISLTDRLIAAARTTPVNYETVEADNEHLRATARFDRVFWLGDLNYRIESSFATVKAKLKSKSFKSHEYLIVRDQLQQQMSQNLVFRGFREGPLNFSPTYKFKKGTGEYDNSKPQRVPSWTDRILYRSRDPEAIVIKHYDSINSILVSDHAPVVAKYEIRIDGLERPHAAPVKLSEVGKTFSQACIFM